MDAAAAATDRGIAAADEPQPSYRAVARIDATFPMGVGRGTGFLVGESLALTAFHVVADRQRALQGGAPLVASQILLTFRCGAQADASIVEGCLDPSADFALLRLVWRPGAPPPEPLPLFLRAPSNQKTPWQTFGYPDDNPEGMVNDGYIQDATTVREGAAALQLYSTNAAARAHVNGLSGAPVLVPGENDALAVVGLLRSAIQDQDRESREGVVYGCPLASVLKNETAASLLPVPDPVFGLPGLPQNKLPEKPYKYLTWFTEAEAEVFFGRSPDIAQVYRQLTDPAQPGILLLYGQAGVGKSSFLDAGLQPRLKWYHEVIYLRRDAGQSLLETLRQKLGAAPPDSLAAAWHAKEQTSGRPLVVIFDQLEEVYTRPSHNAPNELQEFCAALVDLYGPNASRVRGRLVLSFRKEWFAEIQKQMETSQLDWSKHFLQTMDKPAVIDAILGLTKTERLRNRYGLQVSAALADDMAAALLKDRESPLAPTLQILLTRMWDRAIARSRSCPEMKASDFEALEKEGLGLGDFLDRQLEELGKAENKHEEWVDSGLALDVLDLHVTPSLTARECSLDELLVLYASTRTPSNAKPNGLVRHQRSGEAQTGRQGAQSDPALPPENHLNPDRAESVRGLLQSLKDAALLVDSSEDDDRKVTRLCHDTLATLVQLRYAASDKPGQRARRILEARAEEWKEGTETGALDPGSLAVVESGAAGMRAWTPRETELVAYSRNLRRKRTRTRRVLLRVAAGLALAIACLAIWALWERGRAVHQAQLAQARMNISESKSSISTDPSRALMLAVAAIGQSRTLEDPLLSADAQGNLASAVEQARVVNTVKLQSGLGAAVAYSSQGIIATFSVAIQLWDARGNQLPVKFDTHNQIITSLVFSPDGNTLASCSEGEGQIEIWDLHGNLRGGPYSAGSGRCALAFAEGGNELVSYVSMPGTLALWTLEGRQLWTKLVPGPSTTYPFAVGFEPDGREIIAVLTDPDSVGVWDLSGKPVGKPFRVGGSPNSLVIDDHGGTFTIVTAGQDPGNPINSEVAFWNIDGKPAREPIILPNSQGAEATLGMDGKMLAIAVTGAVHFTNRNGEDVFSPIRSDAGFIVALDTSGSRAAVLSLNGRMQLLDTADPMTVPGPKITGTVVKFSPTERLLAVGTPQGTVDLESVGEDEATMVRTLSGPPTLDQFPWIARLAFDQKGERIAAVSGQGRIRVWKTSGQILADIPDGACPLLYDLRFSGNGIVESCNSGVPNSGIFLLNLQTGRHQEVLPGQGRLASALSPDGKSVAAGLNDNTVRIWNLQGQQLGATRTLAEKAGTFRYNGSIAYSSDGKNLIVRDGNGAIQVLPLDKGTFTSLRPPRDSRSHEITGNFGPDNVALSPNGDFLFLAQYPNGVLMWSVQTGVIVHEFTSGSEIALSPDGKILASGDPGIHLSRADWHEWLDSACTRLKFNSVLNAANSTSSPDREDAVTAKDTCQKLVWSEQP